MTRKTTGLPVAGRGSGGESAPRAGPGGGGALARPIFSQERRILVNGDGADDADNCADAEAAGKGKGNGGGLFPFSVTINTGECTPPPWRATASRR